MQQGRVSNKHQLTSYSQSCTSIFLKKLQTQQGGEERSIEEDSNRVTLDPKVACTMIII